MAKRKVTIQPGDMFLRRDNPNALWVVDRIITHADHPPHALLRRDGRRKMTITVAVSVLEDPREFARQLARD